MSLLEVGYKFPDLKQLKTIPTYPVSTKRAKEIKEECKTSRSLTFWITDLSGSIQLDVSSVLSQLRQNIILPDHKVDNLTRLHLKRNKRVSYYKKVSNIFPKEYLTMSTPLTENMIRSNFELYKSDPKIVSVDAFVCAYMCEMWMPFNKTILFKPALGNNLERCFETGLDHLNEHLKYLTLFNNPHEIIVVAMKKNPISLYRNHCCSTLQLQSFLHKCTQVQPYTV